MTVTVLSAIFGGYDQPIAPPVQDLPVRWVMVTDGKVVPPEPWEHHLLASPANRSARLSSRYPKCMAVTFSHDDDPVLWLDACAEIVSESFVSTCITALGDGDVAMWTHPHRSTITEEAKVASTMRKYEGQPLTEQAAHYLAEGYDDTRLWANTSMMWAPHVSRRVGESWWQEQLEWGDMDQLAWPVIVDRYGLDVRPFPGSLYDGEMVRWRQHRDDL